MPSRNDPLRNAFGALVSQISRQWRRATDAHLQPFGLTEATWLPMIRIARAATPLRQKDLAAALQLDASSVVRLLDNLEAAGLIQRQEADDRRAKAILLTARGRAMTEQVEAVARGVRTKALAGLSDEDLATATRVLEHIGAVLTTTIQDAEEKQR